MVATLEEVQESAGEIQSLLADYREVLDSHLAEFLEEQAWRLVPMEWTTHLGSLSEEDLARAAQGQLCETAPQSLRDFAARCRACTVAKQSRTSESRRSERPWMGKKKAHEAAALADIVEAEAREEGATCVVEVGAGKGNLCGELRDRGIGVAAMEANQSLAQSIIDRAAANSVAEGLDVSSPGDIAAESMDKAALDGEGSYIVAALHACGDLVRSLLLFGLCKPPCCEQQGGKAMWWLGKARRVRISVVCLDRSRRRSCEDSWSRSERQGWRLWGAATTW